MCVFIFLFNPVQPSPSAWSRGVGVVLQSPWSHRRTSVSWSSSTRPTVPSKSCELSTAVSFSHTHWFRCSTVSWGVSYGTPRPIISHHQSPAAEGAVNGDGVGFPYLALCCGSRSHNYTHAEEMLQEGVGFYVVLFHTGRCHRVPLEGLSHPLCLKILLTCYILACWWESSRTFYVSIQVDRKHLQHPAITDQSPKSHLNQCEKKTFRNYCYFLKLFIVTKQINTVKCNHNMLWHFSKSTKKKLYGM